MAAIPSTNEFLANDVGQAFGLGLDDGLVGGLDHDPAQRFGARVAQDHAALLAELGARLMVKTLDGLLAALKKATPGSVVFLDGRARLEDGDFESASFFRPWDTASNR